MMRLQWRSGAILLFGLSLPAPGGCIPDVVPDAGPGGGAGSRCAGVEDTCGPAGDESCCASADVPGGSYERVDLRVANDVPHRATVSSFKLDRFEVTVGRFRKFVEAYPGSRPEQGDGAHPAMRQTSGWSPAWDASLPETQEELIVQVSTFCDINFGGQGYPRWTDEPTDEGEALPMNCLSWFVAFAFCAWDGGRLPTEAEWNYAAAGGEEQRTYPWGADAPDASRAVFECRGDGSVAEVCAPSDMARVGSRSPAGDGRFGQADLAGNMFEWTLDADVPYGDEACVDCAALDGSSTRVVRGGAWFEVIPTDEVFLQANARNARGINDVLPDIGVRCARDL